MDWAMTNTRQDKKHFWDLVHIILGVYGTLHKLTVLYETTLINTVMENLHMAPVDHSKV